MNHTSLSRYNQCLKSRKKFVRENYAIKLQKTDEARNEVYMVKDSVPNSCFVKLMEAKRKHVVVKPVCNLKSLSRHAENLIKLYHMQLESDDLVNKLCESIKLSAEEIKILEEATTTQADSEIWKEQRVGRLTVSKFNLLGK